MDLTVLKGGKTTESEKMNSIKDDSSEKSYDFSVSFKEDLGQ